MFFSFALQLLLSILTWVVQIEMRIYIDFIIQFPIECVIVYDVCMQQLINTQE